MNTTIPITVIGRPLAARSFVGCDLMPGMEPIDLRRVRRFEQVEAPAIGKNYMPYTHSVERWIA